MAKTSTKKIKAIQKALKNFPKLVKQNEKRGASFRKLVKDFAPTKRKLAAIAKKRIA